MRAHKIGYALLVGIAAGAIGLPVAAPVHADDPDVVVPADPEAPQDPYNPDYWDSGQHAGGTGEEAQDNGPSYNNQDQPAGGTGEEANSDEFEYSHGSEDGGAF